MRKIVIALSLLLAVAAAHAEQADDRGIEVVAVGGEDLRIGTFHLLAIAINDYQDPALRLKTCLAGATELKSVLTQHYTFEPSDCRLLLDAQATRDGIIEAIRSLANQAGPQDAVVIYYAGHGNIDKLTKTGSWIPWDASYDTPARWIGNDEIKKLLKAMKARHVLLISDSCFAGDFFRGSRPMPEITDANVRAAFQKISRRAMTAGGVEPVADGGKDGQSVYTWWLLTALREASAPYVLPEEVHDRLKKAVAANSRQNPMFGFLHDAGGEPDGSIVLFKRGTQIYDHAIREKMERIEALEALDKQAAAEARRRQEEIAAKQNQLKELDERLAQLQAKIGTDGAGDLDTLLVAIREKERRAAELEELRKKAEAIEEARRKRKEDRRKKFESDYAKYEEITASGFCTKAVKKQAWAVLCRDWGLPADTEVGCELSWREDRVIAGPAPPGLTAETRPTIDAKIEGVADNAVADSASHGLTAETRRVRVATPQGEETREITYYRNRIGMEFVKIESGTFTMGSPTNEERRGDDEKQHRVTIRKGFYLAAKEVTQDQWRAVMGTTVGQQRDKANPESPLFGEEGSCPIYYVSWHEALEFCRKLSDKEGRTYRLPTEAEWEYACRAGTTTPFYTGATMSTDQANYDGNHTYGNGRKGMYREKTTPIGSFPANAWGLYDMHGNVWEWCQSAYKDHPYTENGKRESIVEKNVCRVFRGGSWWGSPWMCRSALRPPCDLFASDGRYDGIGFRVGLDF